MAINLGDVNFRLGADARSLKKSVGELKRFGQAVDAAASMTGKAARQVESSLRKQEKAATDALRSVLTLNNKSRGFDFGSKLVRQANKALREYNSAMTGGVLSATEFQRAQTQFKNSISATGREFSKLKSKTKSTATDTKSLSDVFKSLSATAILVNGPLGGIAARLTVLRSITSTSGIAMAAFVVGLAAGIAVLSKFGLAVVNTGRQMEGYVKALTAVTGSTEKANKTLQDAKDIAKDAGQAYEAIIPSYTRFQAAAKGTSLEGAQSKIIFTQVSKALAILQAPVEQVTGTFRALEQIMSKGQVQAEELRGQLGDRLPGAFQIAARAIGVTTTKLNEMLKKGQVVSSTFLPKFATELAKTFGINARTKIDTYNASFNKMVNSFTEFKVRLDELTGASSKVKSFFDATATGIEWVTANIENMTKAAVIGGAMLLTLSSGGILKGLSTLTTLLRGATGAQWLFNIAVSANPYVLAASAIVGLVLALILFRKQLNFLITENARISDFVVTAWEGISNAVMNALEGIEESARSAFASVTYYTDIMGAAVSDFFGLFAKAYDMLAAKASSVFNMLGGSTDGFLSDLKGLINTSIALVGAFFSSFSGGWDDLGKVTKDVLAQMANSLITNFEDMLNKLIDATNSAIDALNVINPFANLEQVTKVTLGRIENEFAGSAVNISKAFEESFTELSAVDFVGNMADSAKGLVNDIKGIGDAWVAAAEARAIANRPLATIKTSDDEGGNSLFASAVKMSSKASNALAKFQVNLTKIYQEISLATKVPTRETEKLKRAFEMSNTIEKYRTSLVNAGVSSELVTTKIKELTDALDQKEAIFEYAKAMNTAFDSIKASSGTFIDTFVDDLLKGELSLQSFVEISKQMLADLAKSFLKLGANDLIGSLINGFTGGSSGGSGLGDFFSSASTTSLARNGTSLGAIPHMANGGVQGILSRPTIMSTNIGPVLGGEAGKEAILPLATTATGEMGVRAIGSSEPSANMNSGNVYVNISLPSNTTAEQTQTTDSNGDQFIDIIISTVNNAAVKGKLDPGIGAVYGLRRQGRKS